MLSFPRSLRISNRQARSGSIHDNLPGVDDNQARVQVLRPRSGPVEDAIATEDAVCAPPHVGDAAAVMPAPEIDNRFEEVGGNPAPAQLQTHAHTAFIT